ncbi:MAG: hypothetical protein AAGK14_04840 [Verrucomicrobiota bacterium]
MKMESQDPSTDRQLREYYDGQRLSAAKVEAILESGSLVRPPLWRRPGAIAFAVAAAVAILAVWSGFLGQGSGSSEHSLAASVAGEVAKAHAKSLAPEVVTQDYATLQARLDRVDFALRPTRCETSANCVLLGGRYCSIQGELAAQLRLQKKDTGELYTLFVTRETPELRQLEKGDRWIGDANVRFWHEDGRFYALAGPRAPARQAGPSL